MAKRNVYVVDDEEPIRRSLKLMLAVQGYEVTCFETGLSLLNVAPALVPGCILLDIRMPDMDGIEVQRRLTARGADLPVIFMTGHGDVAVAASALQAGAVQFLEKPFAKAALGEALGRAFLKLEEPQAFLAQERAAAAAVESLSEQERAVLAALARGQSNELVAQALGMTTAAVEISRAKIFVELKLESLPAAVQVAHGAGLLGTTQD